MLLLPTSVPSVSLAQASFLLISVSLAGVRMVLEPCEVSDKCLGMDVGWDRTGIRAFYLNTGNALR